LIVRTLLLVSGSLRNRSASTAVLRTATHVAPEGVECHLYDRLASLPAFNPDDDRRPLHPEVEHLRDRVHGADAIVFSTPEYAGALPGSLKNLLDWTIGDAGLGSIDTKPVAWLNVSPRGADLAHRELRTVLGYAHASIIDAACALVPVSATMIGSDGCIDDPAVRTIVTDLLRVLADAVGGVMR
jgi:NAD(P)H-dependent FMN reductase